MIRDYIISLMITKADNVDELRDFGITITFFLYKNFVNCVDITIYNKVKNFLT